MEVFVAVNFLMFSNISLFNATCYEEGFVLYIANDQIKGQNLIIENIYFDYSASFDVYYDNTVYSNIFINVIYEGFSQI